jgi:hypothetical protein
MLKNNFVKVSFNISIHFFGNNCVIFESNIVCQITEVFYLW